MIEIIKNGDLSRTRQLFICQHCGCEWYATSDEFKCPPPFDWKEMNCPCCSLPVGNVTDCRRNLQ